MIDRARRRRLLRRAAVAVTLVGLSTVAIVVSWSRHEAVLEAERAARQTRLARASKLVALGRSQLDPYPTAALAFARKSLEVADTIEARLLALEALWRGPVVSVLRHGIDCSRLAFSPDGAWVACSGFTQRVAVLSRDGTVRSFDVQPTMADARSTVPLGTPPELLTWLPGDDRVRDLSLDGRELRSYPGEVHHLRLLTDGGFATCGPARPGARERVVRAWRPGSAGPQVLARWAPRPGMRFDQPGIRPLDIDPRLRWMAYGWENGLYRLARWHGLSRRAAQRAAEGSGVRPRRRPPGVHRRERGGEGVGG